MRSGITEHEEEVFKLRQTHEQNIDDMQQSFAAELHDTREKAVFEGAQKAKREADEEAEREAEEKAKRAAEEKFKREAEEKAKRAA